MSNYEVVGNKLVVNEPNIGQATEFAAYKMTENQLKIYLAFYSGEYDDVSKNIVAIIQTTLTTGRHKKIQSRPV